MMQDVVILGGEGNGGVVAACIEDINDKAGKVIYNLKGFLNDYHTEDICGYPVLGKVADAAKWAANGCKLSYGIYPIGHGTLRTDLYATLGLKDEDLVTIIHPSAFISKNAEIGPGCFIMANCYVGPQTKIGKSVYMMANSIVGHNDVIGDFCHLSAMCSVSSYITIGTACDICLSASVLEKLHIDDYCVIGAKAMMTKSTTGDSEMYVGVPARLHRKITKKEYVLSN